MWTGKGVGIRFGWTGRAMRLGGGGVYLPQLDIPDCH